MTIDLDYSVVNRERTQLWVDALRSGKYPQTSSKLCDVTPDSGPRYCCLGVAQLVFIQNCGDAEAADRALSQLTWDYTPSRAVANWFGWPLVPSYNGEVAINNPQLMYEGEPERLSSLNDREGLNFNEIADLIEDQMLINPRVVRAED